MLLLLFTHVYTWSVLASVVIIFLAVMFKLNYYPKTSIILVLLVVLSSVAIDIARMMITGSASGIDQDVQKAVRGAGLGQFSLRWSNLLRSTYSYLGGQFSNFIILGLGLYWLLRSNLHDLSSIFLMVFLSVGLIPLLFGNFLIQTRVLYEIPFQIPAAIALTDIRKQVNGTLRVIPLCVWLLAMSITAVSNFSLTYPS
jgi:hypothetical protein